MNGTTYAGVAVQNVSYSIDKNYDYLVPDHLVGDLTVGSRVLVPFGRGTTLRQGVVITLHQGLEDTTSDSVRIKPVAAVLDETPLYDETNIRLGEYMRDHTFCTLFDALKTMVPAGLQLRTTQSFALADPLPERSDPLSEEEQAVLQYLSARTGSVKKSVILSELSMRPSSRFLENLQERGYLVSSFSASRLVGDASERMVRFPKTTAIPENGDQSTVFGKLTKKQTQAVGELRKREDCSVKELCYYSGVTEAVISGLIRKGIFETYEKERFRRPYQTHTPSPCEISLTPEQERAYQALLQQQKQGGGTSLLYGVTGSGKTQVYLKLIDTVRQQGNDVIVMVPEISLTPQLLDLFTARYGDDVAVFHSALSAGERLDEWKRVKNGMAHIAVGTRSAVFAPVSRLGLVILDEEQERTYQSDMSPRYHARDIARYRCAETGGLLLLGSATPSFESYTAARSGRYQLLTLTERYGSAVLPEVTLIDMRKERRNGNRSSLSLSLQQALASNLQTGRQSILLMNRRGYNTYAACESCGEVVTCPNCSISLTYHRDSNRLLCHYCGYSIPFTRTCHACGEEQVRYTGQGTQRVEEELQELFPKARILRMDADSTMQKFSYDEKLHAFRQGEYDIMIGTQMVAKGLDFENVTLVGVLSADNELFNDDYKSMERTFDLITQVVGRAGRGQYRGTALIQTIDPENEVLRLAAVQDYPRFYESEIGLRRAMIYPPYCSLFSIRFKGPNEDRVRKASHRFLESLKAAAERPEHTDLPLIALGPMPDRVARMSGNYYYHILLKSKNTKRVRALLATLLREFGTDRRNSGVSSQVEIEG